MEPVRVLIVEDEAYLADCLCRALSLSDPGYLVETCTSGRMALGKLAERDFRIVVTDLHMPGMDGLSLLKLVHEVSPQTRSILMTAYGSPEVASAACLVADCYLAKPFHLREFVAAVQCVSALANIERSVQ